jgi:hypothetical protein
MEIDRMNIERDALIRRDILRAADSAKAAGGIRGRLLMNVLDRSAGAGPEDDRHLAGLCVDLVNAGLLTETDQRYRTSERRTLDNTAYAITANGTAVLAGAERSPLVFDDRL